MNTVLLIDGNALMHRAYHALPLFKTRSGIATNAVYGFLSTLHKSFVDYQPDRVVVCFDTPVPTFRKKMYSEYQSHRPKMENLLSEQFPIVKEALDAAGIVHLEKEGYEADDVIGTVSRQLETDTSKVLILTGDRDIMQLVDNHVFVLTPQLGFGKEKIYDASEIKNKFGISPDQIPDLKALMGDASDNYKGAKGIGPKTAAKLLNAYGSVDNLLDHLKELDPKIQDILKTHKKHIVLSHKLATILRDVPLKFDPKRTEFRGFDIRLKKLLSKYEMYSLIARLFNEKKASKTVNKKDKSKHSKSDNTQIGLF